MQESIDNSVLIVEDDARLQSVLARGLRRLGFEVHTAGSLAGARDALSTIQISAIVVDLGLPDGSGWDLVRWTRSVAGIHPRTIVVTADYSPAPPAPDVVPDAILGKPFAIGDLAHHLQHSNGSSTSGEIRVKGRLR